MQHLEVRVERPRAFALSRPLLALLITLLAWGGGLASGWAGRAGAATIAGDERRAGWYSDQSALSPANVGAADFGQVFDAQVTGQVYAQPLLSRGVLVVATEANMVYGLDPQTGAQKWSRNLGSPFGAADIGCGDLAPTIGVTGTPVIDEATGTAYLMSKRYLSGSSGAVGWFAEAIDVATGAERAGFPVPISGAAQNVPGLTFQARTQHQRPGLLLLDGVVYAGFGGHCTVSPYEGWVIGVSTAGAITSRWVTTDGTDGGGIWQSGGGLASDRAGSILLATGNGPAANAPTAGSTPPANLGDSVVRLTVQPDRSLKATDFFTPYNASALYAGDIDLGAGGPVVLPRTTFGTTARPDLVVAGGKEGYLYLLDANSLGGYRQRGGTGDAVVRRIGPDGGVWSRATAWPGDGGWIYLPTSSAGPQSYGTQGELHAYQYGVDGAGEPTMALAGRSPDAFGFTSGAPIVTSDGTTSGSALVWVVWSPDGTGANSQLRAYDPVPVSGVLQMRWSAPIGQSSKFSTPVVGGGRIYVGTRDGHVRGFGRPAAAPLAGSPLSFGPVTVGSSATATATFTANRAGRVTSLSGSGAPFTFGSPTPALPADLAAGATLTVPVTYSPTATGPAAGTLRAGTDGGAVDLALTGRGRSAAALLTATPSALSFGGITTGASRTAAVTFANDGGTAITLTSTQPPAAPFTVSGLPAAGSVVQPGATVQATVTFAPTSAGDFQSSTGISGGTADGQHVEVPLIGSSGSAGALDVTPTTIDVGAVPVGASVDRTFTVANRGGTNLTLTRSKPPITAGFSAVTQLPEGTVLQPGQVVTETIRFRPTTTGAAASTWSLNGDGTGGPVTVQLSGSGSLVTGDLPGPAGGGWSLGGSSTLDGGTIVLTKAQTYQAGTAIYPGAVDPRAVSVAFDLDIGGGSGADGAALAFLPAGTALPATGSYGSGMGVGGLGGTVVAFDTYPGAGEPSGGFVSIATTTASAANGAPFVYGPAATVPGLRGSVHHVTVSATDGVLTVGIDGVQRLKASVSLPSPALVGFGAGTGSLTDRHAVSSVAVHAGSQQVSVAPSAVTFPATDVGGGATAAVVVTNPGPASRSVAVAAAAPFGVVGPTDVSPLAAGASRTVQVSFSPTAVGASSGTLDLAIDGVSAPIPLSGTGRAVALPDLAAGGWVARGNAAITGSTAVLTSAAPSQVGSVFWPQAVTSAGLEATFTLDIGGGGAQGGDGATFALATAPGIGKYGGGLGWSGLGGVAVTFDTYKNGNDPATGFVGIATAGKGDAITYVGTTTNIPSLRGTPRAVRIVVSGGIVTVMMDGTQVLRRTVKVPTTVYPGFTAGTGDVFDRHAVSNVVVRPPSSGVLTASPTSVAFGNVAVGASATTTVVVTNTSSSPAVLGATTIDGPFTSSAPAAGTTLAPGARATMTVTCTPTTGGAATGTLRVPSDRGAATVSLTCSGAGAVVQPPTAGTWATFGAAAVNAPDLVLTTAARAQAGAAFAPGSVATEGLRAGFTLSQSGGTGGDGLTFALVPTAGVGKGGGGLGWSGLGGVAVTFDLYRNGSDPGAPFVGLATAGSGDDLRTIAWAPLGPLDAWKSSTHAVVVQVAGGTLTVSVDGKTLLGAAVGSALPSSAAVGFTAGTGDAFERQAVRDVSVVTAS